VGGLLCGRDRSKNPRAPDAKSRIVKLNLLAANSILTEIEFGSPMQHVRDRGSENILNTVFTRVRE
jgi:hypothetical protein